MASISKIVRTVIPPQTITALSMLSSKLGSRNCSVDCPGAPSMYDLRKLSHNLSPNTTKSDFETLKNIPTGVFRDTSGEILGLGAGKKLPYKNPEYFSFHHNSFYDLNIGLRQYRKACPKLGRKPI